MDKKTRQHLKKVKKHTKKLTHAEMVWERERLKAATATQRLDEAWETVTKFKGELEEVHLSEIKEKFDERKKEVETQLLRARDNYLQKLKELDAIL